MSASTRAHEGKLALVTGAAQGIGQAIALALAEQGAQVIATDLASPQETVSKIGPSAYGLQLDVTREDAWHSLSVESRRIGEIDIVVNNAGYFPNRPIDELDLATQRQPQLNRKSKSAPPGNNRRSSGSANPRTSPAPFCF